MTESTGSPNNLPIACALTPEDLQGRRTGLLANLVHAADEAERTDTGYRFRFAPRRQPWRRSRRLSTPNPIGSN